MKIIMVTPAVPHPFGNTAAKWFYVLINTLLEQGHQVVCLSSSEESAPLVQEAYTGLKNHDPQNRLKFKFFPLKADANLVRRKWRNLLYPFSELLYVEGLVDTMRRECRQGYDILHLEQLWTGWLGVDMPRSLLNVHHFEIIDWEEKKSNGLKERKAFFQMKRATARIIKNSCNIRFFTSRLREKAATINPRSNSWVVPFALDLSLYSVQPPVARPVVGMIGSMHWEPSRSAGERLLTRIWPLVKARVPEAELLIAGWNAKKYLGRFMPLSGVTLTENLAHPTEFFSQAAVMAYAPSRGSGMKIKVMEAMAYGVPVVTTWEGVEGLDYEEGIHAHVAEDDALIAANIVNLLQDESKRQRMRQAARELLENKYSPGVIVDRMYQVYGELLQKEGIAF